MLPGLNVLIGADTSGLEKGVKDAERQLGGLRGTTDRMGRGMQSFGNAAQKVGARLSIVSGAVAAVGGGMFLMAKNTADAGDEIAKTSRAAGVSADALQELRFALGQAAGTGEAETATMLTTLTRRMGEAAAGNDTYADALGKLGVSLEDVASGAVGTDEVFTRLADAMKDAGSDSEAAAMGMELLGRQGAALGGQLRESGADIGALRDRAQELGIVLSGETLEASEQFNDKMDELSKQMGAAKAAIGQALLPAALGLATAFQDKIIPAIAQVAEAVAGAIEWFGNLPGPVQEAAGLVAAALGVGGPIVLAVGVLSKVIGGLLIASGPIGLFIAAAGLLFAAWQKWGDDIKRVVGDAAEYFKTNFGGIVEAGQIIFDGLQAQAQNFIDLFKAIFTGDLRGVMDAVIEIVAAPLRIIAGLFQSDFAEPLRETIGGAVEWVKDSFNGLMDFFRELPGQMLEIGRNIVQGLLNGFNEMWEAFKDNIREKVDWIPNWVRRRLGIASPSKVFHEIGMNIGQGLSNGIDASFGMVRAAVQGLGQQVTSGAWDMASGVVDAMGQMFQGSKPIAAAQALINTFQGITEALKLPFPASLAAAARVAAQGFAAVRGIQSARPGSSGGRGMSSGGGSSNTGQAQAAQVATQRLRLEVVGSGPEADAAFRTLQLVQQAIDNGGRLDGIVAERVAG